MRPMHTNLPIGVSHRVTAGCLLLLAAALPVSAGPIHRYTFSEAPGSAEARDSVGAAHGTVQGGATFSGDGLLTLDGADGYVDLPNGIISSLNNATFEAWVTFAGGSGAWQRIFDFGNNLNGEGQQGEGTTYLFLTPRVGTAGTVRFALRPAQGAAEVPTLNGTGPLPTTRQSHVAVTYDFTNKRAKLFVDGRQVAFGPVATALSGIQDVNNWLGRSNWPDAYFNGSFNEFRIYDTALSGLDVALSAAAGPDTTQPGDPGALQSVGLTVTGQMIVGTTQQAAVTATYASVANLMVTAELNTTYQSSNPNVATVSATGLIQAVAPETATITASYSGQQDSESVQVNSPTAPPAVLKHRYSFNDNTANDSVGTAHGTLMGDAAIADGQLVLPGGSAGSGHYLDLPGSTIAINTYPALTLEVWSTQDTENQTFTGTVAFGGTWENGFGRDYIMFQTTRGDNVTRGMIAMTPDQDAPWADETGANGPELNDGLQHHYVLTISSTQLALYIDGVQQGSTQTLVDDSLSGVRTDFAYMGRGVYDVDALWRGSINECRLYEGILTTLQIAVNAAAGPERVGVELGELQTVRVEVDNANLSVGGLSSQASVFANFANVNNVNITTAAETTFSSSDTKIATVSARGRIDPVAPGKAKITASYGGKQASADVTVAGPVGPAATLLHRYSFSEAAGSTTVEDLVGDADGTLVKTSDTGDFTGDGKLTLAGVDGYVDLPNGTISSVPSGSASFEAWVTPNSARTWERIFDFGSSTGGEDVSGTGETYLFLSPVGGAGVVRFAITSGSGETPVLDGAAALAQGQESHAVVTYNMELGVAALFVNGQRVDSGAATIPLNAINDINTWLGRSQWNDPYFTGQYNEFRIYDGVLTEDQVAISAAAGPNVLGGTPGALQTVRLVLSANTLTVGGQSATATAFADFANVQSVNVTTLATTEFSSSQAAVASVSASGVIEALSPGTATIRVAYGGKEDTEVVTVNASTAPPAKLIHRYSFSETAGATTIEDSVGTADGTLKGTGATLGGGKLVLDGTGGYVDLPNRLVSVLTDATFETWVTARATRTWERIFDFGNNANGEDNQGTGTTFFYLSPRGGTQAVRVGFVTGGGVPNLDIDSPTGILPDGQESHVAVVVNDTLDVLRLYIDGQRVAAAPLAHHLSGLDDVNVWLGRSNWPDAAFTGDFNEFRIYDGALSDAEVAASFTAGADAVIAVQPSVSIARAGAQLTIAWPESAAGYILEASEKLGAGASWTPVGTAPRIENGLNKVNVQIIGTAQFYRLAKRP